MEEEDWVAGREQRQTSMKAKAVVRGGGRHIQGGRRNWAEGRRSVLPGGRSDQDSRVRAEAAQAGEGKWVVGGSSPESEHPPASAPASHPSSPRLGPRDWRRRRGRATTRRARIAGGAQALRRPLLWAPPLRGGQVRARRRAPKVRSAPAGVHGHRLRRGALTGARANKQTCHHCPLAWASSVRRVCRGGGQPRGGTAHRSSGGPRREGWRADAHGTSCWPPRKPEPEEWRVDSG